MIIKTDIVNAALRGMGSMSTMSLEQVVQIRHMADEHYGAIKYGLKKNGFVILRGFGMFSLVDGEVTFKPDELFKERINNS